MKADKAVKEKGKIKKKYQCLCCGYMTLETKGEFDICPVCFWEDDAYLIFDDQSNTFFSLYYEIDEIPEETLLDIPSGANHRLTLREGRKNYKKYGACKKSLKKYVRKPKKKEYPISAKTEKIKKKRGKNMTVTEAIETRRSIRSFQQKAVSKSDLEDIVKAAGFSPSWKNSQTAGYVIIQKKELIDEIAENGVMGFEKNKNTISNCAALVVLTTVSGRCGYEKDGSFTTRKKDKWEMFDAGIAAQTFMLAAHEKGIGSVVLGIFDEDYIAEIIELEEGKSISALIAIGYPAEEPKMPKRKPVDEIARFVD